MLSAMVNQIRPSQINPVQGPTILMETTRTREEAEVLLLTRTSGRLKRE